MKCLHAAGVLGGDKLGSLRTTIAARGAMPGASDSQGGTVLNESIFNDLQAWGGSEPAALDKLYHSPFAVHSVFRALPPLARLYVSRLLFTAANAPSMGVDAFAACLRRRQRAHDRHELSTRALKALRVLLTSEVDGIALNPPFAAQLRCVLAGELPLPFGGPQAEQLDAPRARDDAALERFAAGRLERILNFLVGSSSSNSPSNDLIGALIHTALLENRANGLSITSAGFRFLLKDSFSQVWVLLRSVIKQQHSGAELRMLNFVFKLSFANVGALYYDPDDSPELRTLLTCLDDLGVIRLEEKGAFRPTAVGKQLVSAASRVSAEASKLTSLSRLGASAVGDVRFVVETNFRVYAYTTSEFQMNLLGLFSELRYRLPNLVVSHLTRDAVREALKNGISAEQIITYLNAHADARMKKGLIPSNVDSEIRLWEGEQERVQLRPGVLINFESMEMFNRVVSKADELGARLTANARKPYLIVQREAYPTIKSFMRSIQ